MRSSQKNLKGWQFWILNFFGFLSCILVIVNISDSGDNKDLRQEIDKRQEFINKSIQLSRLNNEIIKSLAQLSISRDDHEISRILTSHGIVVNLKK